MTDFQKWCAQGLQFLLEAKFLQGFRTQLGSAGMFGFAVYCLVGPHPNYELAVATITNLLMILGVKPPINGEDKSAQGKS